MSVSVENQTHPFLQNVSAHVRRFKNRTLKTLENSGVELPTVLTRWNTTHKVQIERWVSSTQPWVRHPLVRGCLEAFAGTENSNVRTLAAFIEKQTPKYKETEPSGVFERNLEVFSSSLMDKLRAENHERGGLTGITLLTAFEDLAQTLNFWLAGQYLDTLDGAPINVTNKVLEYLLRMTAQEMQMDYSIPDTVMLESFNQVSKFFRVICS